jgi:hypothetical protein
VLFGSHHSAEGNGWDWESGGRIKLNAGNLLVVVGEVNASFAQPDVIILSRDPGFNPEALKSAQEIPEATPASMDITQVDGQPLIAEPASPLQPPPQARLRNRFLDLEFVPALTAHGTVTVQRLLLPDSNGWTPVSGTDSVESYRVLYRDNHHAPAATGGAMQSPAWDVSLSPRFLFAAGGASIKTRMGPVTAPWLSAQSYCLRPISVSQVDAQTVVLTFPPLQFGVLRAIWHLGEEDKSAQLTMEFTSRTAGYVSLGYHGVVASSLANTDFILLPFRYQGHRFPEAPMMTLSALTSTPLALVSLHGNSYAVMADPARIPFAWANNQNSAYGLGIRNETGQVQPFAYAPILGQQGSEIQADHTLRSSFRVYAAHKNWIDSYNDIAESVYHLADYRQPIDTSLSQSAWNLLQLMKSNDAAGWSAEQKAPWNIEGRDAVTQSAPLTYLSYYLLTGDETFYDKYALPSLEYLISRSSVHSASNDPGGDRPFADSNQPLGGPVSNFGAGMYASAYRMTRGMSPVFGSFCLDALGNPRLGTNGHIQPFEEALELYQLTGDQHWRTQAIAGAETYISKHIDHLPTQIPGSHTFVNMNYVPDWEGLLNLYSATGDERFLKASRTGAYWLLTGLWTQPLIPAGEVTVNKGGFMMSSGLVWWKADHRFRLGLIDSPAKVTDLRPHTTQISVSEHLVPAWEVSNVGLGLEEPGTYVRTGNVANILMSTWAPNFLQLARATGDLHFRTAARNATIGRFSNYPGYYVEAQTDQYLRADFPYRGPDVSAIYFHHIPAFAAYVLDYLFTDVETRSGGAISFPSVRQKGYVWFDNRLRGFAPGVLYGESAWLWLNPRAAISSNQAIDVVLAHNDKTLWTVLLNQTLQSQRTTISFDPKTIGTSTQGKVLRSWTNNHPASPITIKERSVEVELPPMGMTVLALDGAHINVPTHHGIAAAFLPLPGAGPLTDQRVEMSSFHAFGTVLAVPPATRRDLYVYIAASVKECPAATLIYRVGLEREQKSSMTQSPCEFSVRIPAGNEKVTWRVVLSKGKQSRDDRADVNPSKN